VARNEISQQRTLWRDHDFQKLWTGQTISAFGSHITGTAIPLAALLLLAATPAQMGILGALGAVPVLLVGLLAGVLVDRLPRRPILITADLARAALLLTVPIAFALHYLRIEQLYAVVFLAGILTVFADVAQQAYLPTVVPPERLVEGNSKLGAGDSIAEIGGPSVAGVLVQIISAPFAIAFDAVSFVISAVCLRLMRVRETAAPSAAERQATLPAIAEGLRLVGGNPILRALAGAMGTFTFFGNFIGTLYALYAIRVLRLSPAAVGVLVGMGGIGALAGAIVAERLVRRFGLGPTLVGAYLCSTTLEFLIPLAGGPPAVAFGCLAVSQLIGDIGIAVYFITQVSLRQAVIPGRVLGRANATMRVLEEGLSPVGALVAGALAEITSPRLTLFAGVAGIVLASLWLIHSPVRSVRSQPVAAREPEYSH
jgi:MFS family permease